MIRLASKEEAKTILNEPQNIRSIGLITETLFSQPWICSADNLKMVFVFWMVDDLTCEAHIACSKNALLKSRDLAKEIITWLFTCGAKRVITNCPSGKISNMAKKVGMNKYKTIGEANYYEVKSWL
jgi:hypothetical protein